MATISSRAIQKHINQFESGTTTHDKGKALEDLICYLFGRVPGIILTKRDELNVFRSEEIDIAFWNERNPKGLYFLPNIILVECKNWHNPIGSIEVSWFDSKLESRGVDIGILIAANGITGIPEDITSSHQIIAKALLLKRRIIVISLEEIKNLINTEQIKLLLQEKICELVVSGTVILNP